MAAKPVAELSRAVRSVAIGGRARVAGTLQKGRLLINQAENKTMIQGDGFNFNQMMICYNGYHRRKSDISKVISENDGMFWTTIGDTNDETLLDRATDFYFQVGESAINEIIRGCISSNLSIVKNVLDLACGHGRVLRHLVKLFINAKFSAADINEDGVDFCREHFGVKGFCTPVNIDEFDFDDQYDLVWAGSLFTHLPLEKTRRAIVHICNYLTPHGIFIFTLHGRSSLEKMPQWKRDNTEIQSAMKQYSETGYGFYEFLHKELRAGSQQHPSVERYFSHALSIPDYGMSLSRPSTLIREIERMENLQILSYREGGWCGHQDVMVIGRKTEV